LQSPGLQACPVYNNEVHFCEPFRLFPQRARRQQQTVTDSALSVEHSDFDITGQRVMLQPVITEDYIRLEPVFDETHAPASIGINDYRHICVHGKQQRFVSAILNWSSAGDMQRELQALALVTATDNRRPPSLRLQEVGHGKRKRSFTGTADRDIANNDNRNCSAVDGFAAMFIGIAIALCQTAVHKTQRVQQQLHP
jgi:hypothetical protein